MMNVIARILYVVKLATAICESRRFLRVRSECAKRFVIAFVIRAGFGTED